jgi:cysteinyl-tRNA synthetase
MQLKLTNTLSNKLEIFTPINNKKIGMYVCGPTIYDNPHIGNGRAIVAYDVLYRILSQIYGSTNIIYVRNITDVDDKIIDRAARDNITIDNLTSMVDKIFHDDCEYLGCISPNFEPRATETIPEMIEIISKLLNKGHAYIYSGCVYFNTSTYKDYGKLAGRDLNKLISGARLEVDKNKKNPADFVLWKPYENSTCSFDSPFGRGRPGWHIECSAMSHKYLGTDFDIHGGGADLMFPHHTNEIAQSCCAFEESKFARYWVHNGFLTVEGEKMSKSLGNFVTIKNLRDAGTDGEVIRMVLLSTHYRSPLDYNNKLIKDVKSNLDYLYRSLENFSEENMLGLENLPEGFKNALLNDLNIPLAFSEMLATAKEIFKNPNDDSLKLILKSCGNVLGILSKNSQDWFGKTESDEKIEKLILERAKAKESKNWDTADRIREELKSQGIILEDSQGKTSWRKS